MGEATIIQGVSEAVDEDDVVNVCCPIFNRRKKRTARTSRSILRQSPIEPIVGEPLKSDKGSTDRPGDIVEKARRPEFKEIATQVPSPPILPESVKVGGIMEVTLVEPDRITDAKPLTKRQLAEENLKDSAAKLDKLLPKDAAERHIHEAISFQCGRFDSRETDDMTQGIGSAITTWMNQRRELRASQGPVRNFVQKWFRLSFPYMVKGLKTAGVTSFVSD